MTFLTRRCFNIQTRHKFDNFCLFSSIALTLIKIKWDIFSISTVFTIIHIIWITSFRQSYRQKVHKYNIFGRQDIIQFFSGVAKYHKYVIYKIKINLPVYMLKFYWDSFLSPIRNEWVTWHVRALCRWVFNVSVTGNKETIESKGWELYGHVIPLFPTDDKL